MTTVHIQCMISATDTSGQQRQAARSLLAPPGVDGIWWQSMPDIDAQVAFWREGSLEDWAVARELVAGGRLRRGLFFAHLALEKLLKALVVRRTNDLSMQGRQDIGLLWRVAARTDSRIEPIPCGMRQWHEGSSPIAEVARREGQIVFV